MDSVIEHKHLLKHPFYQEWTAGRLSQSQLRHYAEQYYQHVLAEPTYLSAVHARTPHVFADGKVDLSVRQEILQNLISEEAGEKNHPSLWKTFALALGATEETLAAARPLPSTVDLIETFREQCGARAFYVGLAALHAFESQIPGVAATKIAGLKEFYGIVDPEAYEFFTVHEEADVWHSNSEWALIERHADTPEKRAEVIAATTAICQALWDFLDGVHSPARA
ncbi:MAG: CADD family putative folate metabolism protein [Candidatus Eremiobacteraeota bacterium]|nr:CADD family putative folate metabolism protein [Candidatus Eremiobacteraeota bacterium]